tara:strand:+ start:266 stop:412 length:147 start_codon:yes stop_codon:yes gene_type:complete
MAVDSRTLASIYNIRKSFNPSRFSPKFESKLTNSIEFAIEEEGNETVN